MAAYMEYITEAAKAIRNSLKSRASDRQIEQDVDDLRKFELELLKVKMPNNRIFENLLINVFHNLKTDGYTWWSSSQRSPNVQPDDSRRTAEMDWQFLYY